MELRQLLVFIVGLCLGGCATVKSESHKASYLEWQPVLQAEDVFKSAIGFTYLQTDAANNLFWVEQRPDEEGRSVLVERDAIGNIRDLTPKPLSVRTRVGVRGSAGAVAFGWLRHTRRNGGGDSRRDSSESANARLTSSSRPAGGSSLKSGSST